MNPPPVIASLPPVLTPGESITYELTRGDLFINSMTVTLRNRMLQIILALAFLINAALVLGPQIGKSPLWQLAFTAVGLVIGISLTVLFFQGIMAVAIAFLMKQSGVVGRHTLTITPEGLRETTDFNDTIHRWPSILRLMSLFGSLYIYVGDQNSHQVPRRNVPPEQLERFLAALRAHCPQLKS
jgi:hypothetical protein